LSVTKREADSGGGDGRAGVADMGFTWLDGADCSVGEAVEAGEDITMATFHVNGSG
jgi:hypothetical protein